MEELPAQVLVCTHKAFPQVEREDTRIEEEDEAVSWFVLVFTQYTLLKGDRKSRF